MTSLENSENFNIVTKIYEEALLLETVNPTKSINDIINLLIKDYEDKHNIKLQITFNENAD